MCRSISIQSGPFPNGRNNSSRFISVFMLISIFVSDILPIFVIAAVGFLLARKLQASVKTLSHVVFYALVPCLGFHFLVTSKMTGPQAGRMVVLAVLVTASMGV